MITLNKEQAKVFANVKETQLLRDDRGKFIGRFIPLNETEKRHLLSGEWHTTEEVLEHLQSLAKTPIRKSR